MRWENFKFQNPNIKEIPKFNVQNFAPDRSVMMG
jgi:hypothetical protein